MCNLEYFHTIHVPIKEKIEMCLVWSAQEIKIPTKIKGFKNLYKLTCPDQGLTSRPVLWDSPVKECGFDDFADRRLICLIFLSFRLKNISKHKIKLRLSCLLTMM